MKKRILLGLITTMLLIPPMSWAFGVSGKGGGGGSGISGLTTHYIPEAASSTTLGDSLLYNCTFCSPQTIGIDALNLPSSAATFNQTYEGFANLVLSGNSGMDGLTIMEMGGLGSYLLFANANGTYSSPTKSVIDDITGIIGTDYFTGSAMSVATYISSFLVTDGASPRAKAMMLFQIAGYKFIYFDETGWHSASDNDMDIGNVLTAATALLTSNQTNVNNDDTVTIGTSVYIFKTTLTPADYEVHIGGSADASLTNLEHAINNSGGTPGTDYQVPSANAFVTAGAVINHTILLTAITAGKTANEYATRETSLNLGFNAPELSGGAEQSRWRTIRAGTSIETPTLGSAAIPTQQLYLDYTNTATVGAVTINKAVGRAIIAAAASSVVVTDSLVTAASHCFATLQANDTTALYIRSCITSAGSFTITTTAAATANTPVDFMIINAD